jgi:ribosomal-protein-alanine N-acetyltransferase
VIVDGVTFRAMREADLDLVAAIEEDLFPDPWPRRLFLEDIRDPGGALAVTGEDGSGLVCYAVAWQVGGEFHIANMAVRRDRQGVGIGRMLLDRVLADGARRGCRSATLEVRPSNRRALLLYRSRAFREVAIRRGYYRNGEDALVMLRELGPASEKTSGLVQEE